MYEFDLPFPPSINSYRACVRNRLITSKKGREYFREVAAIIRQLGLHKENIAQSVVISLVLHPKTLARYDVSNFLKAYEDALVKAGGLIGRAAFFDVVVHEVGNERKYAEYHSCLHPPAERQPAAPDLVEQFVV